MPKSSTTLIFCVLGLLRTIHTYAKNDEGETSHNPQLSSNTDLQSIELLSEIKREEVLPLIIFTNVQYENWYQMPEKLVKFELKNGKIARGTKFMSRQPGNETFLCPKKNSVEKCLVSTSFKKSEPLQCSSEPIPQWLHIDYPCGGGDMGSGTFFLSVYKICETNNPVFNFKDVPVPIYHICYNKQLNKVVYASYIIMSSELLNLKLLTRERSVDYPIIISDDSTFSNHPITSDIVTGEAENSKKTQYRLQQLVSNADMAFAVWRRTAFININYEWMHEKLISLWDEIGAYIRFSANKYITSKEIHFVVNTGVIDINPTTENDNQLCNIWIKMAFVMRVNYYKNAPLFTRGIVILMNNFLQESGCLDDEEKAIEKFCIKNLCIQELKNKFTQIGGQIRCCTITPQILNHFKLEMNVLEELRITNVTVTEDHKTFHFHDDIKWTQARESIREIQTNEILPVILILDEFDGITLNLPKNIYKIEIKDKRIVQGSEFSFPLLGKQFFFCPKENTDEKCLHVKKFDRFEPLQCAKAAIPVIKKISGESGICGFKGAGTLHEVGYEICPMKTHDFKFLQKFYDFCYDVPKKRNLFTYHSIVSPKLLTTIFLLRERDMQHFTMTTDNLVPISSSQNVESKSGYLLQQLVPSEDMAFASWKKTTDQRINANWQHEKLINLWNTINSFIRTCIYSYMYFLEKKYIKGYYFNPNSQEHTIEVENYIFTGIFDIEYESEDTADDQIYNIWVKIIRIIQVPISKQLVILMNNFLITDQNTATSPNSKQNIIKKYCEVSLCLDSFTKLFENIGGRIRCCPMTPKIAELFGWQDVDLESKDLLISRINKN